MLRSLPSPIITFLAASLLMNAFASAQGQSLLHIVPFKAGDEGAKIYRVPAIWWMPKKPLLALAPLRRLVPILPM